MTASPSTIYGAEALHRPRHLLSRIWTGRPQDPNWERPILLLVLALNTTLNFWNLSINGWANYFYTAAVQSGTKDWTAAFFGSSDWGNSITVDKPPLSLWMMVLSARIFGLSPMSILTPQALLGVLSTLLIYLIIRRNFGAAAALIGAIAFFTTPIISLMSRYNNPDPLMVALTLAAVYLVLKNIDSGRTKFLVLAAVMLGLAFMTKQLQGLIILPFAAVAFLRWSPIPWRAKVRDTVMAVGTLAVIGGVWMCVVDLTPAANRPFVGGSITNSVLELSIGYNGIDRLIPNNDEAVATMVPAKFRQVASDAGLARLLNANYGQEIAWLLFAVLFASLVILASWRALPPARGVRATAFLAIYWFLTTYLMLCFMGNQIHTYYTAALAPALALVLGISVDVLYENRHNWRFRLWTCLSLVIASLTSWMLLGSTWGWPDWLPGLVLVTGLLAATLLATRPPSWRISAIACILAVGSLLTGPVLTSAYSSLVPHNGSNPVSGLLSRNPGSINQFLSELKQSRSGGAYEIAFGRDPDDAVVAKLRQGSTCKWTAATYASQTAARLQLALDAPVMPLGGFAGIDPSPKLDRFISLVDSGEICFFIDQEGYLSIQTEEVNINQLSDWVSKNYKSENVNGHTIYDLRVTRQSAVKDTH